MSLVVKYHNHEKHETYKSNLYIVLLQTSIYRHCTMIENFDDFIFTVCQHWIENRLPCQSYISLETMWLLVVHKHEACIFQQLTRETKNIKMHCRDDIYITFEAFLKSLKHIIIEKIAFVHESMVYKW